MRSSVADAVQPDRAVVAFDIGCKLADRAAGSCRLLDTEMPCRRGRQRRRRGDGRRASPTASSRSGRGAICGAAAVRSGSKAFAIQVDLPVTLGREGAGGCRKPCLLIIARAIEARPRP